MNSQISRRLRFFHVGELQAGNYFCGVAGKRFAVWRDQHEFAAPAAHAGFGIFRVVVGDDRFDANFSAQAFFGAFDDFERLIELLARGQQAFAIGEGPAVVLHVGEFDAGGARGFGDLQHFFDLIDVAAVNDEIERDRDADFFQPFEDAEFLCVGFCAGDFFGGFFAGTLEAELEVIEAGFDEFREACFVERHAGGDQVYVEAGGAGGADEFEDVGAGERFAAGEVGLQDAERGGFLEDAGPVFGGEFCVRAVAVRGDWSSRRSGAGSGGLVRRLGRGDWRW